jgi:hypothetical protein
MRERLNPAPHLSQREETRRSRRVHDRPHEENKPTEAPDVEARRRDDRWTGPNPGRHPMSRSAAGLR